MEPSYKTITWSTTHEVGFEGRNGYFKCRGVELYCRHGATPFDKITITAITSKGVTGKCSIDIPIHAVPAIMQTLGNWLMKNEVHDTLTHIDIDKQLQENTCQKN